jgi:hypothetical protein
MDKAKLMVILLAVVLIGYNIYTGATVQKIGIPGIFEIEFGPKSAPTPVPSPKQMDVRVNAQGVVQAGGSSPIQVEVLSGPNSPIADAQVRIDVGGGSFQRSGGLVSEGFTNPHGFFADTWTSPPSGTGITYLITVRASKPDFEPVSQRIKIRVTS